MSRVCTAEGRPGLSAKFARMSRSTISTYQYPLPHPHDAPGTAGTDKAANGEETQAYVVLPGMMPCC